jgi:RNA polymerase sigma-70 factor (ECF subfamily)
MTSAERATVEAPLIAHIREGRLHDAATHALKLYGPEIYALFLSLHRNREDADDVFSLFCERTWQGLARFEGRSSFRTWIYTVAWHASMRFRENKLARREVLITDSQISALALEVRTNTLSRIGEERRTRLQELRETLPPEDQMLLVLRVERELDWKDLARVLNPDTELDEAATARESARMRKRFQLVKEKLRALIREDASQ